MNMTALYTAFSIIFGIYAIAGAALVILYFAVSKAREDFERIRSEKKPVELTGEDLLLRVRNARLELGDGELPKEEPQEGVFLSKGEKRTFSEKYEELDPELRGLLDEFTEFIRSRPECGTKTQSGALVLRYKKGQIAKAVIRRDAVVLEFSILNPELGRMVREEKANGVKIKPVEIRLDGRGELELAKQTALMTLEYLRNEEEYKRDKRNEARREAARLKREEVAASDR